MPRRNWNWNRNRGGWNRGNDFNRGGHPGHLRGKDIGLYYRNKNKDQSFKKDKNKDTVINLKIPRAVETKINTNLQNIAKIAIKLNINVVKPKTIFKRKQPNLKLESDGIEICPGPKVETITLSDSDDNLEEDTSIKYSNKLNKPNTHKDNFNALPSTSSAPDFIPIKFDEPPDYGTGERVLSFRGGGDYKYSYEDIITGTFDEKLEECVSKGITINKSTDDIKDLNADFYNHHKEKCESSEYKKFLKFREKLPAYKKSQEIADVINNSQVVVISGETGCGKSTQVPQIILDDAIDNRNGANVKILVTQPRRIAASSLAARVAQERAEIIGNSVGYAVRLEKVDARTRGSITFCTTGILLADLEVNQGLTNYSHIILDEVHERDCHIDLAMCMLKKVLKTRKDLKLILMSATLDAQKLTQYFDSCPLLHIEGLAYPVEDVYLEDILQMTGFELGEPKPMNHIPIWKRHRRGFADRLMEQDIEYKAEIGPWLEGIKHTLDRRVYHTLLDSRIEILNIDLIYELLFYISKGPPGAILVFLPGIGEITKLLRKMNESLVFPDSLFEIIPLHSKLPSLEQHKIFERPPKNKRKIVIATNIAETSITIDDIVYVLDCAKMKITGLNIEENISTLKTEWVSQANMHQRRGRAGRCQTGICYHLLTSYRARTLPERTRPELQRSNLLEPVLTIKRLRLGNAAEALAMVPSPPAETTVKWAVKHLQQCGGLDNKETLTPLGWHLARLPVHPSAGKLLLFGALFGCLDRAASVAAVWGFKDPFQLIIGKEKEVDEARRYLALGEPSDHVAMSEAIIQWERCPPKSRSSFAYRHFLAQHTLQLLSEMKLQFGDNLKQMGFLASGDVKSAWENRNAHNLSLFKAIIAASLYPHIATVRWINSKHNSRKPKQTRIKVYTPDDHGHVAVHPSSVMVPPSSGLPIPICATPGANWLVYWLKQKTSDLYLIDVTLVYTLPLLFFGELDITSVDYPAAKKARIEEPSEEQYWSPKLDSLHLAEARAWGQWQAARKYGGMDEIVLKGTYITANASLSRAKKEARLAWKKKEQYSQVVEPETDDCIMSMSTVKVRCKKYTATMLFELRSLLDQVLASKVMVSSQHATRQCEFEESVLNAVIELITAEDEQVDYVENEEDSDSDQSDTESKHNQWCPH